jgi:hypothetical protein
MILLNRLSIRSASTQIVFSSNIIGIISASHHTHCHCHRSSSHLCCHYKSCASRVSNLTEAIGIVIIKGKLVPSKVGRHMQCNLSSRKETTQEIVRQANTMTGLDGRLSGKNGRGCQKLQATTCCPLPTPTHPSLCWLQNKSSAPWSIPPPCRKPRRQATNGSPCAAANRTTPTRRSGDDLSILAR